MKRRKFRKPYRIKRRKPVFKNRFFWLGILTFVIAVTFFYLLFFSEIFQVKKVIITGGEKVSKEELKLLIEKKLENKIFFFKTKSIFLVNLNETRREILNNWPQIAEVEIGRGFPDALNIVVIERVRVANWCQEDNCFLIDNEGVIFEEVVLGVDLTKITDRQDRSSFILGERVIEKTLLSQILETERKLKEDLKIQPREVLIVSEERLNIKTSEGWEIYLNPQKDIVWQLTKLEAALEEEIPPETRENLEYIELRFGNFAPYKYQD